MQEVRGSSPLSSTHFLAVGPTALSAQVPSAPFPPKRIDRLVASPGRLPGPSFARGGSSVRWRPAFMAGKSSDSPVRIIGSRELHQNLPGILAELQRAEVRYVLTVHGKP